MTSSPDQNPKSPYLCFVDQGSMGVAAFFLSMVLQPWDWLAVTATHVPSLMY
jgi:hypothetical protein